MTSTCSLFDLCSWTNFRALLEALYFVSGVVLAAGLLIAIKQLKQQKELSKTQNRRDSFKIAAERCEHFGKEIVRMAIDLDKAFEADKVLLLKKCKVTRTDKGLKMESKDMTAADAAAANKHADKISILFNSIEGFSLFFFTGVADDKVGFLACGKCFVDLFEKHFPLYAMSDSLKDNALATQAIYYRWRERLIQKDLVAQKKDIEAKLDPKKLTAHNPYGC